MDGGLRDRKGGIGVISLKEINQQQLVTRYIIGLGSLSGELAHEWLMGRLVKDESDCVLGELDLE